MKARITKPILVLSLLILSSPPAFGEKIYKWVDENGHVNFGSKPPTEAEQPTRIELKTELNSLNARIDKNYAYCGEQQLPGPVDSPAKVLSGIRKLMPKWQEKLRDSENQLAEQTHLKLERQKKGLRTYGYARTNSRSDTLQRQANEYRCMIDWGSDQWNKLASTRQTILDTVGRLGAEIAAEELARDKQCGAKSQVEQTAEPFLEWYDCAEPYETEIRRLERELRYARRQARLVE